MGGVQDSPKKVSVVEVNRNGSGGAFHPFKKEKSQVGTSGCAAGNRSVPPASTSSSAETGGGDKKVDKEGQSQRKARRCWSTELHRKFLHALQQLGGSHRMYHHKLPIYIDICVVNYLSLIMIIC